MTFEFEYAFDEEELSFGGVLCGFFSGTATLVRDRDFLFSVRSIALDGRKPAQVQSKHRYLTGIVSYDKAKRVIAADSPHGLDREVFKALAERIENSEDARDKFAFALSEMEAA